MHQKRTREQRIAQDALSFRKWCGEKYAPSAETIAARKTENLLKLGNMNFEIGRKKLFGRDYKGAVKFFAAAADLFAEAVTRRDADPDSTQAWTISCGFELSQCALKLDKHSLAAELIMETIAAANGGAGPQSRNELARAYLVKSSIMVCLGRNAEALDACDTGSGIYKGNRNKQDLDASIALTYFDIAIGAGARGEEQVRETAAARGIGIYESLTEGQISGTGGVDRGYIIVLMMQSAAHSSGKLDDEKMAGVDKSIMEMRKLLGRRKDASVLQLLGLALFARIEYRKEHKDEKGAQQDVEELQSLKNLIPEKEWPLFFNIFD